jgi:hypothetical protein
MYVCAHTSYGRFKDGNVCEVEVEVEVEVASISRVRDIDTEQPSILE